MTGQVAAVVGRSARAGLRRTSQQDLCHQKKNEANLPRAFVHRRAGMHAALAVTSLVSIGGLCGGGTGGRTARQALPSHLVIRPRVAAVVMQAPGGRRADREGSLQGIGGEFKDRQMKNINKVGPSDAREKAIQETMARLRQRGKVGTSSIMEESMAELGVKGRPAAPSPPAAPSITPALPPPPPPPAAPSSPASPPPLIAATMEELLAAARSNASDAPGTSGIGGAWSPLAATEAKKHKPKVGSWGVFERPADISKAYGGGKRVGVGGYKEDEETRARKRAETDALLQQYRQTQGSDLKLEQEHAEDISRARAEAGRLMRTSNRRAAIAELQAVREWCTHKTALGGGALLELGIALDADGRRQDAKELFVRLQQSEDKHTRTTAQQMLFQEEAASFLKVDDMDAAAEYAKLARPTLLAARQFRTYSSTDAFFTSDRRPPVSSLSEARMVLRSSAVRRDGAGAPERIGQSLDLLRTLPLEQRVPGSAAEALAAVRGEWLLGVIADGDGKPSFAPADAQMTLAASGRFERAVGWGLLGTLATTTGTYQVRESTGRGSLLLETRGEACRAGPLPLPAESGTEGLLYLDRSMLILQRPDRATVWVRPAAQGATEF